jgi:hypothetical protein
MRLRGRGSSRLCVFAKTRLGRVELDCDGGAKPGMTSDSTARRVDSAYDGRCNELSKPRCTNFGRINA